MDHLEVVEGDEPPFTDPLTSGWRVGNEADFVCFDYLVMKDEIILHGHVVMTAADARDEQFVYETWPRDEAVDMAESLIEDAVELLFEAGVEEFLWTDCPEFVDALKDDMRILVH